MDAVVDYCNFTVLPIGTYLLIRNYVLILHRPNITYLLYFNEHLIFPDVYMFALPSSTGKLPVVIEG